LKGIYYGYQLRYYVENGAEDSAGSLLPFASGCALQVENRYESG
jgi:hypothetical protein